MTDNDVVANCGCHRHERLTPGHTPRPGPKGMRRERREIC